MDAFVIDFALVAAVIMALVEIFKAMGLPVKYAPAPALVLGVLAGVLYLDPVDVKRGVLLGLIVGLTAVGAYSAPKNILEAVRRDA